MLATPLPLLLLVLLAVTACGGAVPTEDTAALSRDIGLGHRLDRHRSRGRHAAGRQRAGVLPGAAGSEGAGDGHGRRSRPPRATGTLTRDVVVRFSGPGTIIASGHSGEASLPPVLGLVRSTDVGETWEPISGLGKADYHEIEIVGDRIFALRNEEPGMILSSSDGGKTWQVDRGAVGGRADRRRRQPRRPVALGGLERPGRLHLDERRWFLAPARPDLRRPHRLGRARRALQRGQGRQGQAQLRRRQSPGPTSARSVPARGSSS